MWIGQCSSLQKLGPLYLDRPSDPVNSNGLLTTCSLFGGTKKAKACPSPRGTVSAGDRGFLPLGLGLTQGCAWLGLKVGVQLISRAVRRTITI